jgi:predicted ATPase
MENAPRGRWSYYLAMLTRIGWKGGTAPQVDVYPFSVPAIASLSALKITSRVCFFVGENGSGKSTLLEAIAANYGMPREGGSRSFRFQEERERNDVNPLADALQLGFSPSKTGGGFFLRAESFFNLATWMKDQHARVADRGDPRGNGKSSYHEMSHGESFFLLMETRMRENGLFLLDEPEAALSPQRQLAMLVLIHDVLQSHGSAQFLISTHSPILLGYPDAQIISFDDGVLREIAYDDCPAVQVTQGFMADRKRFLRHLFEE